MPPTIYDIAREANVGIGTVSRVFNDHPSVSKETRERVLRIANRLSYRPHPYARGLARKRTNSIMAVIPFFTTFFFMEILQGVQSKLSELDCDLLLVGVNHPDQVEESLRHNVQRNRVDGILFFSMRVPETFVNQFLHHRTPLVLVDAYHKNFDSLAVDNQQGAYVATNHLIASGHRRIGMLSANLESIPARERLRGYRKALEEADLPVDPSLIKNSASPRLDGFTRESGYEVMQQFIRMGKKMPSAIFVSSDIQAAGALAALGEAGLKCPEEISLVGFDDIEIASHLGLTTMRQPMYEMGVLAADVLLARLETPNREAVHTMFVPKLVIRKTSESLDSRIRVASETAA
ncbi:MAG: LacI family DNA-binding transcriptional regulator [Ignavibacteriales bacterium]|nr:LacI family DNA-binding transcriptional regulator [Ignavibacteriales bacterium]